MSEYKDKTDELNSVLADKISFWLEICYTLCSNYYEQYIVYNIFSSSNKSSDENEGNSDEYFEGQLNLLATSRNMVQCFLLCFLKEDVSSLLDSDYIFQNTESDVELSKAKLVELLEEEDIENICKYFYLGASSSVEIKNDKIAKVGELV